MPVPIRISTTRINVFFKKIGLWRRTHQSSVSDEWLNGL